MRRNQILHDPPTIGMTIWRLLLGLVSDEGKRTKLRYSISVFVYLWKRILSIRTLVESSSIEQELRWESASPKQSLFFFFLYRFQLFRRAMKNCRRECRWAISFSLAVDRQKLGERFSDVDFFIVSSDSVRLMPYHISRLAIIQTWIQHCCPLYHLRCLIKICQGNKMLANKVSSLLPKGLAAAKTQTRSLSAITATSSSPLSPSLGQRNLQEPQNFNISSNHFRSYVSRAHPKPIPEFPVPIGLQMVLDGVEERKKHRAAKWERNKDKRRSKGIEVSIEKQKIIDKDNRPPN